MSHCRGWAIAAVVAAVLRVAPAAAQTAPPPQLVRPPATSVPLPAAPEKQSFELRLPADAGDPGLATTMRDLAGRVLPVYQDDDYDRYLATLSVLQLVHGDYRAAADSRRSLLERRRKADDGKPVGRGLLLDLYADAKAAEFERGQPFAAGFAQAFRDTVPRLSDRNAYLVTTWLATPPAAFAQTLQRQIERLRARPQLTLPEAIELLRSHLAYRAQREVAPVAVALAAEDDRARYSVEPLALRAGGATLSARLWRPRRASAALATLVELRLPDAEDDARAAAAHGYAALVVDARGARGAGESAAAVRSAAARFAPFDSEAGDLRAAVDWVIAQPWSDGRVGALGNGYSAASAWALVRRRPAALKAIATIDPLVPGINFPSEGRVVRNAALRWAVENAGGPRLDDARWQAIDEAWYRRGAAYAGFDRLAGLPSALFRTWLTHPSFDRYWQHRNPSARDLGRLDLPVLTIAGYYGGGAVGARYLFDEHRRAYAAADHTLLLGPYDGSTRRAAPAPVLRGLVVDETALVDLRELRLQWFDAVLGGGARPALLRDRVAVEVAGANLWRRAPSLDALAAQRLRLNLVADTAAAGRLLPRADATARGGDRDQDRDADPGVGPLVDRRDRRDAAQPLARALLERDLDRRHATVFTGEPLAAPLEILGLPRLELDLRCDCQDVDLHFTLYEQRADGRYRELADPYEFRASYAADRRQRRLLRAGERQTLKVDSEQPVAARLAKGSRLVAVLGVIQRRDRELNYGGGEDVKQQTLAGARLSLQLQWYAASVLDLPVRRP